MSARYFIANTTAPKEFIKETFPKIGYTGYTTTKNIKSAMSFASLEEVKTFAKELWLYSYVILSTEENWES